MPWFTTSYDPRYLWEKTYLPFALGENNLGCGPIRYELVGLPAPQFAIADRGTPGILEIRTEATNLDQVGEYTFYVRGCIDFAFDGHEICANSNNQVIEIKNPCWDTYPIVESIRMLEASQLSTDGVFITWPVADTVDLDTSEYGTDKCGPKSLYIVNSLGQTVTYLGWNPTMGVIELTPDLQSPVGLGDYKYVIMMDDYST